MVFNLGPTLFELAMAAYVMTSRYYGLLALVTIVTIVTLHRHHLQHLELAHRTTAAR